MIFLDQMREGLNIMLHPTKASYKSHSIGGALGFYYKFSLIPLVLYIIFSLFSAYPIISALIGIIIILIAAPIGFFIGSAFYHGFGSLFGVFKKPYQNTFSAMVYGVIPSIMFIWLLPIPILDIISIIFDIWAFIVMIFALARLQNVEALTAFGVIVATGIIIGAIIFIILLLFAAVFTLAFMRIAHTTISSLAMPRNIGQVMPMNITLKPTICSAVNISTYALSSKIVQNCTWNGGNVSIILGGGNSGWVSASIIASNGTQVYSKSGTIWCATPMGSIYLPKGNYTVTLLTGGGGGGCGNATLKIQ